MTPADYDAAISGAAFFDDSAMGKLILRGPDAPMFLGNLSTNDIAPLPLGGGCATYFCDARAKALFHAAVYHVRLDDAPHALWLETSPGRDLALLRHLDRYLISEAVELENATDRFSQLHLAGPKAKQCLESAVSVELPELADFQHVERTFGRQSAASLRRRDRLGVPGFDIVCAGGHRDGIARMLVAAGAIPGSSETRAILRVEAGTAEYGSDFDETRFVMEILGAKNAVSYSKGCYLGQEPIVMSRDRAGHAPRAMVKLHGDSPLVAGDKLFQGADEIGIVTSAATSPRFGSIALGYVKWKYRDPETALETERASGRIPVAVRS